MSENLDPRPIFTLIAHHLPIDLHPNVLVVGSLAAAYHYRDHLRQPAVNTKDADIIVQPAGAVEECRTIALRLLKDGWKRRFNCTASPAGVPPGKDNVIRLLPPRSDAYFIELLALPPADQREARIWIPCELDDGLYAVPSFRFMGVLGLDPQSTESGLQYADPAMMALSNLLSHSEIGTARISEVIEGRLLLRSAKDLGRVLALARLAGRDETEAWVPRWEAALRTKFPDEADALAARIGSGLGAVLADEGGLADALHAVSVGLLNGFGMTAEQLRLIGEQFKQDAIEPLRRNFRR